MSTAIETGISKFNRAGVWGFSKTDPADHPPEPANVRPEYMSRGEIEKKGYHVEELADGFYWVTNSRTTIISGAARLAINISGELRKVMNNAGRLQSSDRRFIHCRLWPDLYLRQVL